MKKKNKKKKVFLKHLQKVKKKARLLNKKVERERVKNPRIPSLKFAGVIIIFLFIGFTTHRLFAGGIKTLPASDQVPPTEIRWFTVTGYSSTKDQTDDTPFITANGSNVLWGGVAANSLPFYSKVRFKGMFDGKIFTVLDRTHERFGDRIDIWFPTRKEAKSFGKKYLEVEIWRR